MKRQIIFTGLPVMAMMFGIGKDLMAQTNASALVKNIVLVHGGFVDGSGWEGVYKALKKDGYAVVVRHEPQDKLLHVQIGPFTDRKDAEAMRARVLADGFNAIVK